MTPQLQRYRLCILYLEPYTIAVQDECPGQGISFLPINDWSPTHPDGSCICQICSLLGNKTPKPAQPNVAGMRTLNGTSESVEDRSSPLLFSLR